MLLALIVSFQTVFYTDTKLITSDRSSDPNSFSKGGGVPPFPIGQPNEVVGDVVGEPLSPAEFLYPPFIVDPPLEGVKEDPIEKAGLFEGDIIVRSVDEFLDLTDSQKAKGHFRNAVKNRAILWRNGEIPYVISSAFDRYERGTIAFAMKEFHDNTCIRFKSKKDEADHIHIIKADGCSSSVGRIGGQQVVSLGTGCLARGVVIHELMHSLGFWHEQARPDRDKYITIVWTNIERGLHYNFGKYDWNTIQNLSYGYDLASIMHYGAYAFAKEKTKPTIIPNGGEEIGQRYGLSEIDIAKINKLYNCSENAMNKEGAITLPDGTYEEHVPIEKNETVMKNCKFWANNGECKKNPSYMLQYCNTACKEHEKNGKGEQNYKCLDSHPECEKWAKDDECRLNPTYMFVYCKKSCNKCARNSPRVFGKLFPKMVETFRNENTMEMANDYM